MPSAEDKLQAKRKKELLNQSAMKSSVAKEMLASASVTIMRELDELNRKRKNGTIGSDETRAIGGLNSNLSRNLKALGLMECADPDEEDLEF